MRLKTSLQPERNRVRRGKREQGHLSSHLPFSPLASPLPLPTQIASNSSSPDWEPLVLVLTRSCQVSLLNPHSCGLNTEDWHRVEAEVESPCHFCFNVCRGNKSVEQEWLIQGKRGKRRQREMLGKEAEYRTFHTSLLDSSPRACLAVTHSTERGNMSGKRVPSQFEGLRCPACGPEVLSSLSLPPSHTYPPNISWG